VKNNLQKLHPVKKVTKNEKRSTKTTRHYRKTARHSCVFFVVKQPTAMGITLIMPGSYLKA
jgi:hypothetical protein